MATCKVMGPAPHFRAALGDKLWAHLDEGGLVVSVEEGGTLDAEGVVTAQVKLGPKHFHELEGYVEFLGCLGGIMREVANLSVEEVINGLFNSMEPKGKVS